MLDFGGSNLKKDWWFLKSVFGGSNPKRTCFFFVGRHRCTKGKLKSVLGGVQAVKDEPPMGRMAGCYGMHWIASQLHRLDWRDPWIAIHKPPIQIIAWVT